MATTAHGTLTANTVASVTVDPGSDGIVVINRDMDGTIWVRVDGQDPVPYSDGTYAVLGAREFAPRRRGLYGMPPMTVTLLSDAARNYSVEAIG